MDNIGVVVAHNDRDGAVIVTKISIVTRIIFYKLVYFKFSII